MLEVLLLPIYFLTPDLAAHNKTGPYAILLNANVLSRDMQYGFYTFIHFCL